MPYQTDERLKCYLDTNQLHREQMCRAILSIDKRFFDVHPRHPRGGPDGGRDIEALFRDNLIAYGAVGFINQANDSKEQKKTINEKFMSDLTSALDADSRPSVFVFFTNINFTIGEKDSLIKQAKRKNITHCEIIDRERMRIALDSSDGFSIRFQYLNIPLSEAEQATFFARWGDDIQSIISTGFQRIESTLERVIFLQESTNPLSHFTLSFELNRKYLAEEIGHFRLFCLIRLKEPKYKIFSIIFGSSDRSNRMRDDLEESFLDEPSGIKYGISSGQWEHYFNIEDENHSKEEKNERYKKVASSSACGRNEIEFISISYSKNSFIRYFPTISMRDLDEAMFLPLLNKSLAEKIKAIHIYSNGYKIQEIKYEDLQIDLTSFDTSVPAEFTIQELEDSWVRIRPSRLASTFRIQFFEETPKRMFIPVPVENSLDNRE